MYDSLKLVDTKAVISFFCRMTQEEINMDDLPPTAPLNQMTLMINELQGLLSQQKEDRKLMESLISQYQEKRSK